jgi:hypothetical protein
MDAFRKDCDLMVLVSNDSDLCEPLRMVQEELGVSTGILNPFDRPSRWLQQLRPSFIKPIREGAVRASQLPAPVPPVTARRSAGRRSGSGEAALQKQRPA